MNLNTIHHITTPRKKKNSGVQTCTDKYSFLWKLIYSKKKQIKLPYFALHLVMVE